MRVTWCIAEKLSPGAKLELRLEAQGRPQLALGKMTHLPEHCETDQNEELKSLGVGWWEEESGNRGGDGERDVDGFT